MSAGEGWAWGRSCRWDFAPWVKELPKRRAGLPQQAGQAADMLLSKASFGSNQRLVANEWQVFFKNKAGKLQHRKKMSNNLTFFMPERSNEQKDKFLCALFGSHLPVHPTAPSESLLITQLCPLLIPLLLLSCLLENAHDLFQLSMERSVVRQIQFTGGQASPQSPRACI